MEKNCIIRILLTIPSSFSVLEYLRFICQFYHDILVENNLNAIKNCVVLTRLSLLGETRQNGQNEQSTWTNRYQIEKLSVPLEEESSNL